MVALWLMDCTNGINGLKCRTMDRYASKGWAHTSKVLPCVSATGLSIMMKDAALLMQVW